MTRTGEALLAAVIAAPADDLPRLAYADFCEEHGDDARAEFIRVQIELARLGDPDPPACGGYYCNVSWDGHPVHVDCLGESLLERERQLLSATGGANTPVLPQARAGWARPLPDILPWDVGGWTFWRGFVEEVTTTCALWLAHGPALVRAAPLERVTFGDKEPYSPAWEALPPEVHPCWWWVCASRHNANRPEALPRPLFRALARLRREERRTGMGLGFADRAAALAALSAAGLSWAGAAAVAAPPAAGV